MPRSQAVEPVPHCRGCGRGGKNYAGTESCFEYNPAVEIMQQEKFSNRVFALRRHMGHERLWRASVPASRLGSQLENHFLAMVNRQMSNVKSRPRCPYNALPQPSFCQGKISNGDTTLVPLLHSSCCCAFSRIFLIASSTSSSPVLCGYWRRFSYIFDSKPKSFLFTLELGHS